MKIQLISDLHMEMMSYEKRLKLTLELTKTDADVCILAGDICNKNCADEVLSRFCRSYEYVVFVPGNHEYYGEGFDDFYGVMEEIATKEPNLVWLDPTRPPQTIMGQRFIGNTLWYPSNPDTDMLIRGWSDYHHIRFLTPTVFHLNEMSTKYIEQNIQEGDIVVTHMAPSYQSVGSMWRGAMTNCFFVSEMEDVILDKKPKFWFHGHMHDPLDYMIGDTRVVCNPRGYTFKNEGKSFNPALVFEI
jgi:Icc-related predicted phosphoesterase